MNYFLITLSCFFMLSCAHSSKNDRKIASINTISKKVLLNSRSLNISNYCSFPYLNKHSISITKKSPILNRQIGKTNFLDLETCNQTAREAKENLANAERLSTPGNVIVDLERFNVTAVNADQDITNLELLKYFNSTVSEIPLSTDGISENISNLELLKILVERFADNGQPSTGNAERAAPMLPEVAKYRRFPNKEIIDTIRNTDILKGRTDISIYEVLRWFADAYNPNPDRVKEGKRLNEMQTGGPKTIVLNALIVVFEANIEIPTAKTKGPAWINSSVRNTFLSNYTD